MLTKEEEYARGQAAGRELAANAARELAKLANVPSEKFDTCREHMVEVLAVWMRQVFKEAGVLAAASTWLGDLRRRVLRLRKGFTVAPGTPPDLQGKDTEAILQTVFTQTHFLFPGADQSENIVAALTDALLDAALVAELNKRGVPAEAFKTEEPIAVSLLSLIAEAARNAKVSASGSERRGTGVKGYPALVTLIGELEFAARMHDGGFTLSKKQGCLKGSLLDALEVIRNSIGNSWMPEARALIPARDKYSPGMQSSLEAALGQARQLAEEQIEASPSL